MRVTLTDGRQMVGYLLAFDRVRHALKSSTLSIWANTAASQHMNMVLADTEEFRHVKRKQNKAAQPAPGSTAPPLVETEEKRILGLTIVRGTHVISSTVVGPPPADPAARLGPNAPGAPGGAPPTLSAGPGISRPAGRGLPIGLTGPAAGVGGPPPPGGFPPGFPGRGGPGGPPGPGGMGGPRKFDVSGGRDDDANIISPAAGFAPPGFPGGPMGVPRKYQPCLNHRSPESTSLLFFPTFRYVLYTSLPTPSLPCKIPRL